MICLIALPILAILGIFSATHRKIATEAFDCVFRRMTLRKCESGLDTRLKSAITSSVMKRSPKAAGLVFKHFEILSWAFLIMFLLATFFSIQGVYNYAVYGNCNGEDTNEFCIIKDLDPTSPDKHVECNEEDCPENCTKTGGEQTEETP